MKASWSTTTSRGHMTIADRESCWLADVAGGAPQTALLAARASAPRRARGRSPAGVPCLSSLFE